MTAAVSEDWDDLVETLRSDLETVSKGDPEDEEVRNAIDEVWAIVDAAEDRIGSVDAEEVGEVLGVDTDGDGDAIDVESISRELVSEDPDRAAGLSRLVSLINIDEATDYDVGRLWVEDEADEGDVGEGAAGGDSADSAPASSPPSSAERPSEADEPQSGSETDESSGSTEQVESPEAAESDEPSESSELDDVTEAFRSKLGDSLSGIRDRIQEARDEGEEPSESEDATADDESDDGKSSKTGSSGSSKRSSTGVSTLPANRHDMDGVPRFSTMPDRSGR